MDGRSWIASRTPRRPVLYARDRPPSCWLPDRSPPAPGGWPAPLRGRAGPVAFPLRPLRLEGGPRGRDAGDHLGQGVGLLDLGHTHADRAEVAAVRVPDGLVQAV